MYLEGQVRDRGTLRLIQARLEVPGDPQYELEESPCPDLQLEPFESISSEE